MKRALNYFDFLSDYMKRITLIISLLGIFFWLGDFIFIFLLNLLIVPFCAPNKTIVRKLTMSVKFLNAFLCR